MRIQHIQKSAGVNLVILIADHAIRLQFEPFAGMRQQHVPTTMCTTCTGFEEYRIASGLQAMQGQQVDFGGKRSGLDHFSLATPANTEPQRLMLVIPAYAGIQFLASTRRHCNCMVKKLDPGVRQDDSVRQMRRNTSVPLVPPNPKPLDMTTSTLASRAVFGT